MLETKTRYYEAMHDLAVKRLITIECQDVCNVGLERVISYKLAGRTEFYPKYLKNRCAVRKKYYLHHRLMRNIVAKACSLMPEWICNFGRYRLGFDYLDFNRCNIYISTYVYSRTIFFSKLTLHLNIICSHNFVRVSVY